MLRKPQYIILGLVLLLVAGLSRLPAPAVGRTKLAVSGLFVPMFGLAGSADATTERAADTFVSKSDLIRQVDQLRRDNEELKIRLHQDEAVWNENTRLRSMVGWPPLRAMKMRLARVIARDPANWWRTLQIDLGSHDGVVTNDAVMTIDGLVGRVQSVAATRSTVILLGNPDLKVAALIPSTGETGVINSSSSGPQDNNAVDMDYLEGGKTLLTNQTVVTWGMGGVLPGQIPIGTIIGMHTQEFGLTTEVRVKLAANMDALQEVWVLMP